jgi:hypothetical protein
MTNHSDTGDYLEKAQQALPAQPVSKPATQQPLQNPSQLIDSNGNIIKLNEQSATQPNQNHIIGSYSPNFTTEDNPFL